MAKQSRSASESYQSIYRSGSPSVSLTGGTEIVALDDEDDQAPIFSLSKSSMDVVMVSGLPHKRDPAWARTDLRRSSSTNTHSEQNSVTLQQLHPQMWQHISSTNSHPLCQSAQNVDMHSPPVLSPPVLSERWIANMQRWSGCSASTHSRSSTPDTILWKEGNSRPTSFTQETSCSTVLDSHMLKRVSSTTTPSPFTSPLQTPTISSSSPLILNAHQQKDLPETLPSSSLPQSPLQASGSSPLTSNSPHLQLHASTKDEGFPENNMLSFTFPSPICSSVSLSEGRAPSDASSLVDDVIEILRSPGGSQLLERGGVRTQAQVLSPLQLDSQPSPKLLSPGGPQLLERGEVGSPVEISRHTSHDSCFPPELCSPGSSRPSESGEGRSPLQSDSCRSSEIQSPGGTQFSESEEVRSPMQRFDHLEPDPCPSAELQSPEETQFNFPKPPSPVEGPESRISVCHLELPCPPLQSFPTGHSKRSPLVYSLSDSQLSGECCKCNANMRGGITLAPKGELFQQGGTVTSHTGMVDAAVQTISPIGSFWGLRRNTSNSNMGSHSLLGSPPGSRLNLKSSVGSNSNLVSPSSSMFPVSSEEEGDRQEDDPTWESNSPTMHNPERRRSCLKIQGEMRDKLRRRSSMKQVQWDEEGMTWDIHGASVDPELLSTAIQKHLDLKNSPQPTKRPSKKKKRAPKPPLISNVVKAMTPELNPPSLIISSTCMVEPESEDPLEMEKESQAVETGTCTKEETESVRRVSRAEVLDAEEEEDVCAEESFSQTKSRSNGGEQARKKSVIRSLRPGWCGGSRKSDD